MMTNDEAKQFLASQLPERIKYVPFAMEGDIEHEPYFCWLYVHEVGPSAVEHEGEEILETEWQEIARLVEEKMTEEQWWKYDEALDKMWEMVPRHPYTSHERWRSQLDYTTRATSMKESEL